MFVALGVGAYSTAMFHLTTHAFFKALLFLGAGSVIHAMGGEQNISFMGGLKNKIKTTHITFLIGTLAIIGFPLFSGFFSKDEILEKVFEYSPIVWGFTLFSAALTAIYMLRLYFVVFLGNFRGSETQKANLHESPITMTLPLMILALLSFIGGALNLPHFLPENMSQFLSHWIAAIPSMQFLAPTSPAHHLSQPMIFGLMGLAIALVLVLVFLVYRFYALRQFNILPNQSKFSKLGENKFFVDEIYNHLFVKKIEARSEFLYQVSEKKAVKPFIMFFAQIFGKLGKVFQKVQDGNVENYLLYFVLGIISFILLILL
jgi:NADH-quinone oxidoreductase subunit L